MNSNNNYLPNPSNFHECQHALDLLLFCGCCEKHQKNKPAIYEPWVETKNGIPEFSVCECKCDCRHRARNICRNYPVKKYTEEELEVAETMINFSKKRKFSFVQSI
jgi:hypothetical protein